MAQNNTNYSLKKTLIKFSIKVIVIIVVVIMAFVLIAASDLTVKKNKVKNSNNEDNDNYSQYNAEAYSNSFELSDNLGNTTIQPSDEYSIETMWEEDDRYSDYICAVDFDMDGDGTAEHVQAVDVFEYLINAEFVTQYPYISDIAAGEFNGTVHFYRNNSDEAMEYISSSEFDKMVSDGDEDVVNYFTINDDGTIEIAYLEKEKYTITTDDDDGLSALKTIDGDLDEHATELCNGTLSGGEVTTGILTTIETTSIDYQSALKKYVLPFNLLWCICVMANGDMSEAVTLACEIASLAYNGEISLVIDDNNVETTTQYIYDYTLTHHYDGSIESIIKATKTTSTTRNELDEEGNWNSSTNNYTKTYNIYDDNGTKTIDDAEVDIADYQTTYEIWTSTNTVQLDIRKIESWCAILDNSDATYESSTSTNGSKTDGTALSDTKEEDVETFTFSNSASVDSLINAKGDYNSHGVDEALTNQGEETVSDWKDGIENNNSYKTNTEQNNETKPENAQEGDSYTEEESTYTYEFTYDGEVKLTKNYTDITRATWTEIISSSYPQNVTSPEFNDEIVTILKKADYRDVRRTICDTDEDCWFMLALEVNDDTADLIDIIKYIFNEVNGDEQESDWDTIWSSLYASYSSISSLTGSTIQEKVWWALIDLGMDAEHAAACMGNFDYESGSSWNTRD